MTAPTPSAGRRVRDIDRAEVWDTLDGRAATSWCGFVRSRLGEDVLDPYVLTIGFARRFATYKRATLLLSQPERLIALLTDAERPVQFVFAGKAHPADTPGKELIQQIEQFARKANVRPPANSSICWIPPCCCSSSHLRARQLVGALGFYHQPFEHIDVPAGQRDRVGFAAPDDLGVERDRQARPPPPACRSAWRARRGLRLRRHPPPHSNGRPAVPLSSILRACVSTASPSQRSARSGTSGAILSASAGTPKTRAEQPATRRGEAPGDHLDAAAPLARAAAIDRHGGFIDRGGKRRIAHLEPRERPRAGAAEAQHALGRREMIELVVGPAREHVALLGVAHDARRPSQARPAPGAARWSRRRRRCRCPRPPLSNPADIERVGQPFADRRARAHPRRSPGPARRGRRARSTRKPAFHSRNFTVAW